jgi:hypothetical protein
MTPHEMLGVLDDAIAAAPRRPRSAIALELHVPGGSLWGVKGKPLGTDERGPVYGFTRHQCTDMREVILAAARTDAGVDA